VPLQVFSGEPTPILGIGSPPITEGLPLLRVIVEELDEMISCGRNKGFSEGPMPRVGFEPHPEKLGLIQIGALSKVCNNLRPKPFSLHNALGLGDLHNVLPPSVPIDHNDQGSTPFPRLLGPIHESPPSGPGHIPVAVENNKVPVLERQQLEAEEEEQRIDLLKRVLSIRVDA
jgi:hypothetical protein